MQFYTYLWLREDGSPYYAGKGKGRRAFFRHNHYVNPPRERSRIILQEWPSEELAFEGEKMLIAYYGRIDQGTGCLRNLTDGGDGPAGLQHTQETRKAMSAAHLGHATLPETRRKIGDAQRGKPRNLGHEVSPETRRKISNANRGRTFTEEHRRKLSEAKKQYYRNQRG